MPVLNSSNYLLILSDLISQYQTSTASHAIQWPRAQTNRRIQLLHFQFVLRPKKLETSSIYENFYVDDSRECDF